MHYENGDVYIGQFVDDKKEGEGQITTADGTVFTGQWKNGWKQGLVNQTNPDGTKKTAKWVDDELVEEID